MKILSLLSTCSPQLLVFSHRRINCSGHRLKVTGPALMNRPVHQRQGPLGNLRSRGPGSRGSAEGLTQGPRQPLRRHDVGRLGRKDTFPHLVVLGMVTAASPFPLCFSIQHLISSFLTAQSPGGGSGQSRYTTGI